MSVKRLLDCTPSNLARYTKAELLEKVGDKMIRTGPEAYTPFRVIINKMPMDEFSCAAEFYCNHSAS